MMNRVTSGSFSNYEICNLIWKTQCQTKRNRKRNKKNRKRKNKRNVKKKLRKQKKLEIERIKNKLEFEKINKKRNRRDSHVKFK